MFKVDDNKPFWASQINKVDVSAQHKLIIAGTEDNQIKFFDINSHKLIKSMVAHTDAISCLLSLP